MGIKIHYLIILAYSIRSTCIKVNASIYHPLNMLLPDLFDSFQNTKVVIKTQKQ